MKPEGKANQVASEMAAAAPVSYTHLRAHETGEKKTHADQKDEGCGDAAGKELPAAGHGGTRLHIAEEFEVPPEMVDRHGEEGDTACNVDGFDARLPCRPMPHICSAPGK